ncbi:unnamed protein product, partial [Mesorhabditis spiculigera]
MLAATVAGMTSEGGGAVSFPIMTLVLHINPDIARDFALMIQSIGIFTAIAGSGVDICTFSVITLLFRVSEKTATPTTVSLMAVNAIFGFYWRAVIQGGIAPIAFEYLAVCIPAAVTFAPLGSFLGSHFHRLVLAFLIYILEALSIIGFLFTGPPIRLILIGIMIILFGFGFFSLLSYLGRKILMGVEERRSNKKPVVVLAMDEAKV